MTNPTDAAAPIQAIADAAPPLTFKVALAKVIVTLVQAVAGFVLALATLQATTGLTRETVIATAIGTIAVPVATAIHRFSGAWLAQHGEDRGNVDPLTVLIIVLVVILILFIAGRI